MFVETSHQYKVPWYVILHSWIARGICTYDAACEDNKYQASTTINNKSVELTDVRILVHSCRFYISAVESTRRGHELLLERKLDEN